MPAVAAAAVAVLPSAVAAAVWLWWWWWLLLLLVVVRVVQLDWGVGVVVDAILFHISLQSFVVFS